LFVVSLWRINYLWSSRKDWLINGEKDRREREGEEERESATYKIQRRRIYFIIFYFYLGWREKGCTTRARIRRPIKDRLHLRWPNKSRSLSSDSPVCPPLPSLSPFKYCNFCGRRIYEVTPTAVSSFQSNI